MSRWSEREIARKLAERDELEPPPGLLEKIKSEIPPMIPAGTGLPEIDRRPSMPPRQRWLIAASLVAMIGAGLFALHLRMEGPPVKETAWAAAGARQPERRQMPNPPAPSPAVPAPKQQWSFQTQPREAPAVRQQLQRKEQEELKSLGYVSPQGEKKAGRGAPEGDVGSLAGGEPSLPPAAAAPAPPPAKVPAPPRRETPTASPLLDERRAGTGTSQPSRADSSAQSELEKVPAARDPWSVVQSTPGVVTDRINVGGNESGQQSQYVGPGTADRPQPAPAARAKATGAGPLWQVPASQPITLQTDAGTGSYDAARRSIAEGKLPDPAVVRIGQIVNAFEAGDVPPVEGASTPFVHGPQYRLLRVHPGGANPALVSFNPSVVVRYRSIGTGVSALYEIELRPGVSPQDALVAVLHLGNQGKIVTLGDLASSWSQASPGFRLAALAAEFAEVLKGSPVGSSALHRLSTEIGKLPKGPKASELGELVEKVGKIRG
jgi:protein with von Willebrand factor-like domain